MSLLFPDLNLTNFPDAVDNFVTFLDILASDGQLIAQYQSAMQSGNTALAKQILSSIPNASQKTVKAEDLNKLSQAILAIERFYKDNIAGYVEEKQQEWQNTIDQFSYRGDWSIRAKYVVNNFVTYTVSGVRRLYIVIAAPPIGTLPTDNRYWRVLTIQGQQGDSGAGMAYRQMYDGTKQYNANDVVTYDGVLWEALQQVEGITPSTTEPASQYWQQILKFNVATYPIQDTKPENQSAGALWFNTSNNPTKYYYLDVLDNPAKAENIQAGFQAYDAFGNVITGTKV